MSHQIGTCADPTRQAAAGVPTRLAQRIARQFLFKFDLAELGNRATWRAIGELLQQDIERLKTIVGLVDRQIIVALPKLSADQIESIRDLVVQSTTTSSGRNGGRIMANHTATAQNLRPGQSSTERGWPRSPRHCDAA